MLQFFQSLFALPSPLVGVFHGAALVWDNIWWFALPIIMGAFLWEAWVVYVGWKYYQSLNFKLLEITVPKNILKTPKAMEQVFAAAHAPYSYGLKFIDKYFKGRGDPWMSFELVGREGETHFYLRLPADLRNMMETAIYAQYPEAEITEVSPHDDYAHNMPEALPNETMDVNGFEEILQNEGYKPIRTYPSFEDPTEERRVDTMSSLIEAMSRMRDGQQMWVQLILMPTGEEFRKEGEEAINQLLGIQKEEGHKRGSLFPPFDLGIELGEAIRAPFQHPGPAKPRAEEKPERMEKLKFLIAPQDRERADLITEKIAKIAFNTTFRFIFVEPYTAPKINHTSAIHGYIRQFHLQGSNQLKPEKSTTTAGYAVKGLFRKRRLHWRKRLIYEHYIHTIPGHHESVMNIEELATVFHFPTTPITTSQLEKVESKKGTPPASLPIVES